MVHGLRFLRLYVGILIDSVHYQKFIGVFNIMGGLVVRSRNKPYRDPEPCWHQFPRSQAEWKFCHLVELQGATCKLKIQEITHACSNTLLVWLQPSTFRLNLLSDNVPNLMATERRPIIYSHPFNTNNHRGDFMADPLLFMGRGKWGMLHPSFGP